MHIIKVKKEGKLQLLKTVWINTPSSSVPKQERQTLKELINKRKNAERNARLVQSFTR